MALLPIQQYFSINGKIEPVEVFIPSENEGGIYEVIRVVDGIPLFFEEHLERFYKSAQLAGKTIVYTQKQIHGFLNELIEKNQVTKGNVLISCKINLKIFFISHSYPKTEQYQNGVVCGILHAERDNPNAKVFQTSVRAAANKMIDNEAFYEILLVNNEQLITEGSRSNVFFIQGDYLLTPTTEKVLPGITREKVLICSKALQLSVKQTDINLSELATFDAVFLTGTSPKVLPVREISGFNFSVDNKILITLKSAYDDMISDYLQKIKKTNPK